MRRYCYLIGVMALLLCPACASVRGGSAPEVRSGPLSDGRLMGFAAIRDGAATRAFYEGKLGLTVVDDDAQALMLKCDDRVIRLQKIPNHEPEQFTVLGWAVPDIHATVQRFAKAGVTVERFDWMAFQDDTGVATFPNGDMVAWFKDPDGNILSLAQLR